MLRGWGVYPWWWHMAVTVHVLGLQFIEKAMERVGIGIHVFKYSEHSSTSGLWLARNDHSGWCHCSGLWLDHRGLDDAVHVITTKWLVQDQLSGAEYNEWCMISKSAVIISTLVNHWVSWVFRYYLFLLLSIILTTITLQNWETVFCSSNFLMLCLYLTSWINCRLSISYKILPA